MNLQDVNASASPEVQMNENFETLDCFAVYGKRQPVTTGLTWGFYGGRWGGFAVADGTLTLTNNVTNYISVLRSSGAISVEFDAGSPAIPTNWADTANYAHVYKITTSAGAVSVVEDHRVGPDGVFGT